MIPSPAESKQFVKDFQAKLRERSAADPDRVFDDIGNFVTDVRTIRAAYLQVARASGADTPGVDRLTCCNVERHVGVDWLVKRIHDDLKAHRYKPAACLEVVVQRENGRSRTFAVPTIRDRTVQRVLVLVLGPIVEPRFYVGSAAYLHGRGTRYALKELEGIAKDPRTLSVGGFDVRGYYDNISHALLMPELRHHVGDRRVLSLVEVILGSGKAGVAGSTSVGLSQGGPLSNLLANLYRHPLDVFIASDPRVVAHVAYGDDVRVGVAGDTAVARAVLNDVARFAHDDLGLSLSAEKACVVGRGEPFDFLGHVLTWNEDQPEWLPSAKALARYKSNLRAVSAHSDNNNKEDNKTQHATPTDLVLRGFNNYFAQVCNRRKVEALSKEVLDAALRDG